MSAESSPLRAAPEPIWLREERQESESVSLTRERLVEAAIQVADVEGIEAVSIRRIARELETRPMSLYSYFESKDDLLDFMHDAVIREALVDEVPADWQEALRQLARINRAVTLRHPWLLATRDVSCAVGPAALKQMDQSAAAVRNLDADVAFRSALVLSVDTFVLGHVMAELRGEVRKRADEEVNAAQREAAAQFVQRHVDLGELPHLAEIGLSCVLQQEPDASFEIGLDWLIAGAAASLKQR